MVETLPITECKATKSHRTSASGPQKRLAVYCLSGTVTDSLAMTVSSDIKLKGRRDTPCVFVFCKAVSRVAPLPPADDSLRAERSRALSSCMGRLLLLRHLPRDHLERGKPGPLFKPRLLGDRGRHVARLPQVCFLYLGGEPRDEFFY